MKYRAYEFDWEEELHAGHRWGAHGVGAGIHDKRSATEEHQRLRRLYDAAAPLDANAHKILDQIVALEACNWRLEESIAALCEAIGKSRPVPWGVGHSQSLTPGRWQRVWAYSLALRNWLAGSNATNCGYRALLDRVDPTGEISRHVTALLGPTSELKRLRVERLCLHLEFWLDGYGHTPDSTHKEALKAAADALQNRANELAPDDPFEAGFGPRVRLEDNGQLHPCHHKLFRRYDILISSIGDGIWRRRMPYRGTDGFERADTLEAYLKPVEAWVDGNGPEGADPGLAKELQESLGERTAEKTFLAALMASLLRSQQKVAQKWAEEAVAMHEHDGDQGWVS